MIAENNMGQKKLPITKVFAIAGGDVMQHQQQ